MFLWADCFRFQIPANSARGHILNIYQMDDKKSFLENMNSNSYKHDNNYQFKNMYY